MSLYSYPGKNRSIRNPPDLEGKDPLIVKILYQYDEMIIQFINAFNDQFF